eukprot:TRINITY_DN6361_c0_g1_i2.p1 TRINITY_DN6361_c0_g1~~TRINITY_DN6361_c0_g1_i2.p1  ORF type:complete len:101 (-),score=12.53 TRINITY_DN6361_c0_g1_i2:23-325(-)
MCIRNRVSTQSTGGGLGAVRTHTIPGSRLSRALSNILEGLAGSSHTNTNATGLIHGLSLIHISEPTRLLSISYAVFCLKKKKTTRTRTKDGEDNRSKAKT